MAPTQWNSFLFPPMESTPLLNFQTQDAVNVSWFTTPGNASNFDTLELIYWWSAPLGSGFAKIVNETVPLNGSRIFSTGYGLTFPAVGWFQLFYMTSSGAVVDGPGSLGFNVSNSNPSDPGRLWTQDGSDTTLSDPAVQTSLLPPSPSNTAAPASGQASASPQLDSSTGQGSGLSSGAIAGIVIGVAAALLIVFVAVLLFMRRSFRKERKASAPNVTRHRHEIDGREYWPEKDGQQQRGELPANPVDKPLPYFPANNR